MSLAKASERCPSFSLVWTAAGNGSVVINDAQPATRRCVRITAPRRSNQRPHDPLMTTVDMREEPDVVYDVKYRGSSDGNVELDRERASTISKDDSASFVSCEEDEELDVRATGTTHSGRFVGWLEGVWTRLRASADKYSCL